MSDLDARRTNADSQEMRVAEFYLHPTDTAEDALQRAADEVERLRAENESLKAPRVDNSWRERR